MSSVCERLEDRVFLSAAALYGTYLGVLHVDGAAPGHSLTIESSQNGSWPLGGSLTIGGVGTYNFVGTPAGKTTRLVFAGNDAAAGELIIRSAAGGTLRGTFAENIGNHIIRGVFRAKAAAAGATSTGSAIRVGKVRASQANVTGTYQSVSNSGPAASLAISGESASGLVAASLALAGQTFNATGIVQGNQIDLVLEGGGTATFTRSGASLRGTVNIGQARAAVLLVNRAAKMHTGRAGGSNGTASSTGSTSVSSGSSASLSGTTGATVSSPNASTSLVVSSLGQFINIGGLTAFGSGAPDPFGNLNTIGTSNSTSSTRVGVPGTGSTGVISSGTLPASGNTTGTTTGTGSGFTMGVGASPPVGSTTAVPGTSGGVVGSVPVTPTTNPVSTGDLYGTPIYGTTSPGFH